MNFLSAAEHFASIDRSAVTLNQHSCLHTINKFSNCDACHDICPVEAIQVGKPPALDQARCETCLACLPTCPTGAYHADDEVAALLTCVARMEGECLELVCETNSQSDLGVASTDIAIQVRGCLAGLGSGAYLTLAAMGLQNILVRMDACDECSWGALQPHIEQQIQGAQRLLEPHGWFDRVSCVRELQTEQVHERPVWDADNPPLSRRDLFRLASRQSQIAAARAISANEFAVHQKILGRDRRRIIAALDHIELLEAEKEGTSLEGLGYATLSISNACTACGVCARSCPTGALIYNQDKENLGFSLEFIPDRCIACQVCLHVCAPGAVSIDDAPRYKDVFRIKEPIILREGSLARCGRCGVLMASRPDSTLCPLCEHRRKNPFGSKLPPGFKGRDRTDPGAEEK